MKHIRSGLLAAASLMAVGIANAQPVNGLYVGGGLGYNVMNNFSVTGQTGVGGPLTGSSFKTDGGFVGLGSVGWGFGNGFRAEIEGNYRSQTMGLNGPAGVTISGGRQSTYGVMVNALYDFDMGGNFYPYLGAGVGYEWSAMRGSFSSGGSLGGSQGGLGVQGIAGIAVPVGPPGLSLTAEYRMLTRPGSDTNNFNVPGGGTLRTGSQFNHSAMIGLRYAFNSPTMTPAVAAAPAAAPAPAAARTYLVFFDWDRADLSPRARQIIGDAAQASTKIATTRIEVSGNADKTGTAAYNRVLSQKRGDTVAAELVRLGVPQSGISVTAFGDTKPIVPTASGVREPQNRNVEIVLK